MRVVLAHDSFTQLGGAERVAELFHQIYPDSPMYTLVVDKNLSSNFLSWDMRKSLLQKLYDVYPKLQYWLFLIPAAIDGLKVESDIDILLSSSSGFVRGIKKPKGAIHIDYCHTPTRFLWVDKDYVTQEVPFLLRPLARMFLIFMKRWDLRAASRVDYFIANSKEVQSRIKKIYGRDSEVIYPAINDNFWKATRPKGGYFLIAGRLQPHKNNELIIEIFNELGLPLHVVGTGRQENYLRSIAKSNIKFLGRISDEALRDEYSGARGFIYPQVEDFGLMPLEAAGCGTATLALGVGGALETVIPGVTGELFEKPDKELIKNYIKSWNENKYLATNLSSQAQKFSNDVFKQNISGYINKVTHAHRG